MARPTVKKVVVVEDDDAMRSAVSQWLRLAGYDVTALATVSAALETIGPFFPGVVVTDLRLSASSGLELLADIVARDPDLPVLIMSAYGDIAQAVEAMRLGAYDFLEKPFDPERLVDMIGRACDKRTLSLQVRSLQRELDGGGIETRILGNSEAIHKVRRQILDVASTPVNVVIYGETGTGKELVARSIHDFSGRRSAPYVAVNCGAIPETLFENELFGSEQGSFTGAAKRRIGRLEYANGGTVFLDEIESMPLSMQVKLLRAIQEKTIERLGSNDPLVTDFRTIAASKVDLARSANFRSDLYYRIGVAEIRLPPLRERQDDILFLFENFIGDIAKGYGRQLRRPSESVFRALLSKSWPGNVRELHNAAERYVLGLPMENYAEEPEKGRSLAERTEEFERSVIQRSLIAANGNISAVMAELNLPRRTLNEKMTRYGIDRRQLMHPNTE